MQGLASSEQEMRLRRLFADLLIKKGYEKEVYLLDLSAFFKSHGVYTLSEVQDLWRGHLSKAEVCRHYFSLYVHIPFCRKRCSFCRHYEWTCSSENQLRLYLDSLVFEIRAFKEIFSGVMFKSLYVGGGTANILSPEQIDRLLSEIDLNFRFDDHAEKTFECNPNESSMEKLSVFAGHGINRVSFGVQSYSQDVLGCTHRAHQSEEMVASAIRDAQRFPAFHKINADLLIGLHNDSPKTVCDSFLKLAQLGTGSISLYALKPPLHYIKKYYRGRQDLYDEALSEKLRDFERLVAPITEEFDYVFTPLKEIRANFDAWMFTLRKNYHTGRIYKYVTAEFPIDCLGLGTGAVSTITDHAFYKNQSFTPSAQGGTF
ncbi:MAG TPA: radical SAM protein, partial [Candidatus Omnitrophota bacterium]|nr:radical SAM protein [Candidatus Omnitrophota bacterium]